MKKLISNIFGLAVGAFAFLGFLMAAIVQTSTITKDSAMVTGYDFISFESKEIAIEVLKNLQTLQLIFSILAVVLFIIAGLLIIVSLAKMFVNSKKVNLAMIQNVLAFALSVIAIVLLILVIAYVVTYNNSEIVSNLFQCGIGIGTILIPVVTIIGSVLISMFNQSKKK